MSLLVILTFEAGLCNVITTRWLLDATVQYALANMLVNLTNSYDKQEETEEREQLKKLGTESAQLGCSVVS